ncbi:NADH-ubiquinone oxidoreductase chain G [hydrothermal vent metagenome]|uniref:NADH-ubiquinone oxidoreductase chain G n=1 Tax=hydrothermal vent metagenome TaxID=652676 RepID=A0A1W1C545_9ZZZZ
MIKFKIDNIPVEAKKGETILEVARRYGIYIPTMCYISKTSPCASCRICSVEVKGVDGYILSCNTPPTEGIEVITNSDKLQEERTNIMKLYDVNHPLECGVCDKSGECDLQNMTLEFNIAQQSFSAKDQYRPVKHWNLIDYDPALCILCEKCVHVCNEVIGDDAIEIKMGGYKSTIIPKNSETLDCTFCGECIAVCPVGALVSSGFKYRANAWELNRIPATCAHCSAGCPLEYEVRHTGLNGDKAIYRVKNNFEFTTLCGAGRFGYDFDVKPTNQKQIMSKAIEALQKADAIRFSSIITNEEAVILQKLKEKLGIKLINEDARLFKEFMESFAATSGKRLYSADLEDVKKSDAIIVLGTQIATDNPGVRYAMTVASKQNGAKISYFHPIEDTLLQNVVTQFVKMEAGTEEGVVALLAKELLKNAELPEEVSSFFKNLDEGYLEAESNVGEEELKQMSAHFKRAKRKTLIVGADLFAHKRAKNIAKLIGLIEKYSEYKVLIVPKDVNTLGVSLLCDLDTPSNENYVVGYNASGDFTISSLDENADMVVPALNQQEGTLTSIDKRVLPTNVALEFKGASLNDIASALGVYKEYTVDYTKELGEIDKAFSNVEFDTLENFLDRLGEDIRGYKLKNSDVFVNFTLEEIDDLPEFNGTVIYHANPVLQFNAYTARTTELPKANELKGSQQFAMAAKIKDGDRVMIDLGDMKIEREFKVDEKLKGTIAINPTFDLEISPNRYRFEKSKIERVQL